MTYLEEWIIKETVWPKPVVKSYKWFFKLCFTFYLLKTKEVIKVKSVGVVEPH